MAIENYLIFNGTRTSTFGVYISGEGTFNAPARAVEMITIPGRDGALALDKGYFENIEVTYPAFFKSDNLTDMASMLSALRNELCSQRGYIQIADTFHDNEYRLGVYKSGLEVDVIKYNTAGSFDITFDCKPQRFLMSGEAPITVSSGDTILNPTHFESKPMLEVEGYGTIGFNGFEIELENTELGDIVLSSAPIIFDSNFITFDKNKVNNGDRLYFSGNPVSYVIRFKGATTGSAIQITTDSVTDAEARIYQQGSANPSVGISPDTSNGFVEGVASSINPEWSGTVTITPPNGTAEIYTVTATISIQFDGVQSVRFVGATIGGMPDTAAQISKGYNSGTVTLSAISTVGALGDPTYVDCDLGEVYMIKDGSYIGLNRYVDLGSELPTLASGSNEITFDNTIRDLKIVPRWWQV